MRIHAGSYHHHLHAKIRTTFFFSVQVVNTFCRRIPHLCLFSLLGVCRNRKVLCARPRPLLSTDVLLRVCKLDIFFPHEVQEKSVNNSAVHTKASVEMTLKI